jgi:SAM-dependent methyltransferase
MKQAYSKAFAQVYNKEWSGFATSIMPKIEALFESAPDFDRLPKTLLDICCGTRQFANHFLSKGYTVHGVDLSPYMIEIARDNNKTYVSSGMASFSVQDASDFRIKTSVSYAVCLFDSMNHIDSLESVSACFQHAHDALTSKGLLVFDINTRKGLHRWNSLSVQEDDDVFIIERSQCH